MSKVVPPDPHHAADTGRAVARVAAGAIPIVGSAVAEVIDKWLPDPTANRRDQWEKEVSDGLNQAHDRIDDIDDRTGNKQVLLTRGAAVAAKYMIEKCPDGLANKFTTLDDLENEFPEIESRDFLDGLGDLEMHGLIDSLSFIGAPARYRLSDLAYEILDPQVFGWDPKEDAKALATAALAQGDSVDVKELDEQIGWPRRRFNPALRLLLRFVAYESISRECQMDYVTGWFLLTNAERAAIRAFSKS
jgi:hypothetical protein